MDILILEHDIVCHLFEFEKLDGLVSFGSALDIKTVNTFAALAALFPLRKAVAVEFEASGFFAGAALFDCGFGGFTLGLLLLLGFIGMLLFEVLGLVLVRTGVVLGVLVELGLVEDLVLGLIEYLILVELMLLRKLELGVLLLLLLLELLVWLVWLGLLLEGVSSTSTEVELGKRHSSGVIGHVEFFVCGLLLLVVM